jgi:hypothetical protein
MAQKKSRPIIGSFVALRGAASWAVQEVEQSAALCGREGDLSPELGSGQLLRCPNRT